MKQKRIEEASRRFSEFTGVEGRELSTVIDKEYDVVFRVGTVDGVLYTTIRDGKTEKYIHEFRKKSRPHLAVSHDGKQLFILGGGYTFTERGIVDH